MLRPLIEDFHQRGHPFGVTAFSDSALKGLEFLKPIALFAGLSPAENEWREMFAHFNVKKLILAKYDLWPGLLLAAEKQDAPVIIVNAQDRKSLRVLKRLFTLGFQRFPRIFLFANQKKIADRLFEFYGRYAEVALAPDPRWERVARRKENAIFDQRLVGLLDKITHLNAPIGVIGSAWTEDLEKLIPVLQILPDSIVVVPHDLSLPNLERIRALLQGIPASRVLLVDQMGLLAELYQAADWVWVGGGFGKGIHSLIEPAFHAIPIACGPNRFEAFPEAEELMEAKVLTRCETSDEIKTWLVGAARQQAVHSEPWEKRTGYRALLEECIRIQ